MKLIIITSPVPVAGETYIISELVSRGVFRIHLRRPDSSIDELRSILSSLPEESVRHIVLHDHHELANEFPVAGLHLNYRNPMAPLGYKGQLSRSCHSLQEISDHKSVNDYLFLSPIFDSISKKDVQSAFSKQKLLKAKSAGIIDNKVYALGGITLDKIDIIKELSFGGVAILGDFWLKAGSNEWIRYIEDWQKRLLSI